MDENIPSENFLSSSFTGEIFQGWTSMGFFWVEIPPGRRFLEPFSSYNWSIFIFQKIINEYNNTFDKKTYTLNS